MSAFIEYVEVGFAIFGGLAITAIIIAVLCAAYVNATWGRNE